MLIQELFRSVAARRNLVTQEMAATLAPAILRELAAIPALGGSGEPAGIADPELRALLESLPTFSREELLIFSKKGFDQSLSTHLINGLFAGMNLAERLPASKELDELEQRIWALGYTVHDYTKAYGCKVSAGQLPSIRQLVLRLGALLDFTAFMPDWHDYLDDIVFTAQNTQTVQGANLNTRDYTCHIDRRQRETIRLLSSVTDLLVHVTAPSDVIHRDTRGRDLAYNLRQKMDALFGYDLAPRLTYHKLLEVRGLLSNLINNAVIEELRAQGYDPFLFFPEGVIYLVPRKVQVQVDSTRIAEKAWKHIAALLTGGDSSSEVENDQDEDEEHEGGLRMQRTKDYMKIPPILYELLDIESLKKAGQRTALAIRNSKTAARLGAEQADTQGLDFKRLSLKERDTQYSALGQVWAAQHELPVDVRVDQLAEFLVFLRHRLFAELFPKMRGVTALLLNALDLQEEVAPERAERQRGGTPTGWFFAAACYLKRHPELDPHDLAEVINELSKTSLEAISASGFSTQKEGATARVFNAYLQHIIEIDGALLVSGEAAIEERFNEELRRYIRGKDENKVACSLCASPYDAQEQDKSIVLFKPQQYSNKSPLDRSRLVRGICPICALEMMLRQVQQGLLAGKAQDQQVSYLYLYPTYFFTAETAEVVKLFAGRLQYLNLRRLIFSHLEKTDFHARDLLTYEDFIIDEEQVNILPGRRRQGLFSEEDLAALFFIPFRPAGDKLTETDTWIVPTFFALALPLLLGVKCVATTSFALLYNSASDFQETVRLDGAHPFTTYVLAKDRLRVNETPQLVERLLRIYSLHLNVYADDQNSHWGQLTSLAKDLATDPLYVFQYYDRYKRRDEDRQAKGKSKGKQPLPTTQGSKGVSPLERQRYMGIYYALGGPENMGFIGELVEAYTQFYRAEAKKLDSAYAALRPLSTAIDVVVESDPRTVIDDLHLLVAGALNDDQERVRSGQAEGFDPIVFNRELGDYPTRLALSRQKIEEFTHLFLEKCFVQYCDGDRALLRERTNRLRSAARFYYLTHLSFRASGSAPVVSTSAK
jgi:CRISPR-associated protein Csc3